MKTTLTNRVQMVIAKVDPKRGLPLLLALVGAFACLASAPVAPGPVPDANEARQLFESGNEKFRAALEIVKDDRPAAEAKFREAAGAWREAARVGGIHNGKLECNIANASLLAGDVPGAILAYRRALKIDPSDRQARSGLAAARRSAGTEALALGESLVKKDQNSAAGGLRGTIAAIGALVGRSIEWTSNAVPLRLLLLTAAISYIGLFLAGALRVLGAWRVPNAALAFLFAVLLAVSVPLIASEVRGLQRDEAIVITPGVIARNGPAELYAPAFQEPLRAGLEVTKVESRGAWTKVRLRDGREAWVRGDALAIV